MFQSGLDAKARAKPTIALPDNEAPAFPTLARLRRGVLLGTIAHGLWQMALEQFAPSQQWDGTNYGLNNEQGERGTITFDGDRVVGVFCDVHSERSPWQSEAPYDLAPYFTGIPPDLLQLAQEQTLLHQLDDYRGRLVPVITTAFWSAGERLTAAEPWPAVVANGAHLLRIQLMEPEQAIMAWQENYEFAADQVAMLRALFGRRQASAEPVLVLKPWEQAVLLSRGDAGLAMSRQLLTAVGIALA